MIGMDDLMLSVHGESTAIGVAYDCEFERSLPADPSSIWIARDLGLAGRTEAQAWPVYS